MADPRFYQRSGPFYLGEVAAAFGAECPKESAGRQIQDVAALEEAGPADLSVFSDGRHALALAQTRAAAVVTSPAMARHAPRGIALLLVTHPRLVFAQIGRLFYPDAAVIPGVHAGARVDASATLGSECRIDAGVVIGARAEIGPRCHVGPNAVIGDGVVLGADCRIGSNSAISYSVIGARVEIGPCSTLGGPGFGFVIGPSGLMRTPQLGRVIVEDDVKIDANCMVDRGTHSDTLIGAGTVIDNGVHIGHNVRIGRHCVIAGQSGIAGSTTLADNVVVGGQVAISDHLTIGSSVRIAFKSGVIRNIETGATVGGYPAGPIRQWHRQTAALLRLVQRKRPDRR